MRRVANNARGRGIVAHDWNLRRVQQRAGKSIGGRSSSTAVWNRHRRTWTSALQKILKLIGRRVLRERRPHRRRVRQGGPYGNRRRTSVA